MWDWNSHFTLGKKREREKKKNIYHNKLWKILKEMGVPDYLTGYWDPCIWVKKQQSASDME